jgi:hypothetical protein
MPINDTLVLLAAFLLGFLVGRIPSTSWWSSLRWEIKKMSPKRCPQCGKWLSSGSMVAANHRTAGWIRVCPACYKALYNPFTDEEGDDDGQ